MPASSSFPFKRIFVDHLVVGATRVWWEHHPNFGDPPLRIYKLQVGHTQNPLATDWVDVDANGIAEALYLVDRERRVTGNRLNVFYRIVLQTPLRNYVSLPVPALGQMQARDWAIAREIVRRERLRHRRMARNGVLLKRRRYGVKCPTCRDMMTDAVVNSMCPDCLGVGFQGGYHTPLPFQCFDIASEPIVEQRGGAAQNPAEWSLQVETVKARVLAFPMLEKEDVFVETATDRRWRVGDIHYVAAIAGVPIVAEVELRHIPFSDIVYQFEVGGESGEDNTRLLPKVGCGRVAVTHDYGGTDNLRYTRASGEGIAGATILVYRKADWDVAKRSADYVVASTTTLANGRWADTLMLDPGEYRLVYTLEGQYGPDYFDLVVTGPVETTVPPDRHAPGDFGAF